jgi:hypothetical protein
MKILLLTSVCALCAVTLLAAPGTPIPNTGLAYSGPGTVAVVTDSGAIASILTNAPAGGLTDIPPGLVLIILSNATGGHAKFTPANKADNGTYAILIEGSPTKIDVDCGQAKGIGQLPYMAVNGKPEKIMFKGMSLVGKVVVLNAGAATGVHIQNISKRAKHHPHDLLGGISAEPGRIRAVITTGKLKRLQSNHGGFGGVSAADPGVIAIGEASPDAQIKPNPKGRVNFVLLCAGLTPSNDYDYAGAYKECIQSNAVLPRVVMGALKKLNAKAIGPAVIGVTLTKPIPANQIGKRVKLTQPIVGQNNLVQ